MKNNNYICHAPYLRNSIAYDHNFWCSCIKLWYLHVSFYHFFKILIFQIVKWVEGQKMVQNDKKFCPSHSIFQEQPNIIWLSFMVHLCKNGDISKAFFHFFKILVFQIVKGVKGWKMVQNDKMFSPSRSISQEPNIIWFSFLVHMCKMIISLGNVFIF